MKTLIAGMIVSAGLIGSVRADEDCALGQRYVDLARQRQAQSEFDDATAFLRHAIETCPTYDAYQTLGDLEAQSPQREDQKHAVDEFVSAYQLAPSDTTRAGTLLSYARLLNQDNDPGNAYPIIKRAQSLDPTNSDIAQLSAQIEQRVNHPTKATLDRGVWDSMYKPLRLASATVTSSRPHTISDRVPALAISQQPAAFVPIHFETGTTLVDSQTKANIAVLAHALADPAHKDQHFLFVGHADIRGVELNNVLLSQRRAETIYQTVSLLEPTLAGRIEITGKGSSEPIDLGNTEEAYRANRRLQVLLK